MTTPANPAGQHADGLPTRGEQADDGAEAAAPGDGAVAAAAAACVDDGLDDDARR